MNSLPLTAEALEVSLSGVTLVRRIHFYRELGSTNEQAFQFALQGAPEGTVVIADSQTRGRGRLQRVWVSPPGRNLYLSLILRPDIPPQRAPQLALMAGVAVAEALKMYCPGLCLKWPNDVLIGERKVCGILAEMKASSENLDFVILGIGVNVNLDRDDFPSEIKELATSIRIETGREVSRPDAAGQLFRCLEASYRAYLREGFPPLRERWLKMTDMMGQPVRVLMGADVQEGLMVGLDDAGALLLRDKKGTIRAVMAGDASIMKG